MSLDQLTCATRSACHSCHWYSANVGCRLALDVERALGEAPAMPVTMRWGAATA